MKKTLFKIVTSSFIFLSIFQNVSFADFSDVFPVHKNYEAINYLQEHKIINGYQDGTFKPNQSVNRAEFLKIIIEGSRIEPNVSTSTPFHDVNHDDWYGKYVKHAYAAGWINGYPDGSFKPAQTINKVEALKILAKAQNWVLDPFVDEQPFNDTPLNEWYVPYLSYAKKQNYLEETGSFFEPAQPMTRGSISEVIYRTLISTETEEKTIEKPIEKTPEIQEPEQTPEPIEKYFTPVSYETIEQDFFEKISLEEDLPNHFYENEIYIFNGTLSSSSEKKVTVIVNNEDSSKKDAFAGDVVNGKFSIPVYFRKSGNYILGIIPGESGSSKATEISILSDLPKNLENTTSGDEVTNLKISYANDKTKVSFDAPTKTLKKLIFTQGDNTISYISRQNISEIGLNYKDFANFNKDTVTYQMESAAIASTKPLEIKSKFKTGKQEEFLPTRHTFDSIVEEDITTNPPDTLSAPKAISIVGTVKTKAKTKAYVTKPDGFVDEIILSTSSTITDQIIPSGGNFEFNYNIKKSETYIFEINNENGEAIMNHPIYVGETIPLLPDFADLQEKTLFDGDFNLNKLREELINEINKSRKEHGLNEIELSDELNDLAQAHSDDMKTNKYFGHNNFQGQTPEDRRIAAGIKTAVGENLAKDTNIASAHYGLMRSGAHRKNLLEKDWTRVGLGITLEEGYLIIAEEFSTTEPTAGDIVQYKNELITQINQKRADEGKTSLNTSAQLESASKYLNDKSIIEDKSLSNQLFQEALELNDISGTSQAIGRIYNIWSTILQSIIEDELEEITNSTWELMGIDIQLDSTGNIHTILILNNP